MSKHLRMYNYITEGCDEVSICITEACEQVSIIIISLTDVSLIQKKSLGSTLLINFAEPTD